MYYYVNLYSDIVYDNSVNQIFLFYYQSNLYLFNLYL